MAAFNVVRVRVKPGREDAFLAAHRQFSPDMPGFRRGVLVATGERGYCVIGEWDSMAALAAARPRMAAMVATFRDTLEELDPALGISDAVSGEAVLDSNADRHSRAYAESMA
jgi:quinol monooxygenase YgiN